MAYQIKYDETMAQYVVQSNDETKLIIRPHEKNKSWIGVEYNDQYDCMFSGLPDYQPKSQDTLNDVINGIDAAIVIETKDLPSMLRELAKLMEEGKYANRR
ncbi:hypothetical protein P7H75_02875 [Vagococcus carniphilus]|uniref:hypothetical protein n=1 Tax=Vagococcus carniphilus TaxID=218144 RepID=UPI00289249BA|nr:hypothetical protein [Vagococcus carniphilus]MDT2813775.1 hypothetical protein [Vagococcus carniphilus]